MGSRFSRTPFDRLRIPYGILGLLIEESAVMHPHVLTATMIQRKYGVAYNTATLLKRRVQLLASELQDTIRHLIRKDLAHRFKGLNLPRHSSEADLTSYREKHSIPQADTLVLYSASQRANKGRKRYRHSGQTASIYKSDKLGGEQIGTLTHILSWKKGPIDIHSIPDLKMEQIAPILDDVLPAHTPLFTDEGYRFYFRKNRNHRMVNHSARSKDSRHKWARNRFCKNGIHNQVAEGNGRALKQAFSTYGWISPKYSTLYLNEYSFFRNLRYFGLDTIASAHLSRTSASSGPAGAHHGLMAYHQSGSISASDALKRSYANSCEHTLPAIDGAEAGRMFYVKEDHSLCADGEVQISAGKARGPSWLQRRIASLHYIAPTLQDRQRTAVQSQAQTALLTSSDLEAPEWDLLKCDIIIRNEFWRLNTPKHRRAKERAYASHAERLWAFAHARAGVDRFVSVEQAASHEGLPLRALYRIIRRWAERGVVEIKDVPHPIHRGHHYFISLNLKTQPLILFTEQKEKK